MLKTYQFKTHCKGDSHSSKTANIILPGLMIKQRWMSLRLQAKWYSNSFNCTVLVETTHLTQVEYNIPQNTLLSALWRASTEHKPVPISARTRNDLLPSLLELKRQSTFHEYASLIIPELFGNGMRKNCWRFPLCQQRNSNTSITAKYVYISPHF